MRSLENPSHYLPSVLKGELLYLKHNDTVALCEEGILRRSSTNYAIEGVLYRLKINCSKFTMSLSGIRTKYTFRPWTVHAYEPCEELLMVHRLLNIIAIF